MKETIGEVFRVLFLICLIILGSLICLLNFKFRDYCISVFDIIVSPTLILFYLFFLACYLSFEPSKFLKKYLIFAIPFCVLAISKIDFKGFFRTPIYIGIIESEFGNESNLTLFDNNSFKISVQRQHLRCFINGTYSLAKNLVTLDRKDLPMITDSLFTFEYRLEILNNCMTAKNLPFSDISLQDF